MPMTLQEYMEAIEGKKKPVEPTAPAETGSLWEDLKAKWDYANAQNDYNQQVAESAQQPFAENMMLGEFRPANARERKLARLAQIAEGNKYGADRIAAMPYEAKEKAKSKILRDFKPEEWTNQVEELVSGSAKENVYGDTRTLDMILKNLQQERMKDFSEAGYENASPYRTGMMGSLTWQNMNKVASKPKPEFVYHSTAESNIPSIGEKGLVPANMANKNPNFMREEGTARFPEQLDKVFFSETPNTIEKLLGKENVSAKTLRKKYTPELRPDLHQDEQGSAWYQTQNPVPPEALEIESAPGQWQPLLDYLKNRGNK